MNIEKLPSGNYRVTKQVKGKRYRVTFDHKPTKSEAEEAINAIAAESKTFFSKNLTFMQAFESYLDAKHNVLSPSTVRSYRTTVVSIAENFKNASINDIDQIMVQTEINRLSMTLAPKSVKNIHGLITAVLKMFRPGFVLQTTLPQSIRHEFYLPTKDEIKQIIDEVKNTRYYVPFVLGILGMRRSEIMAVTADCVNDTALTISSAKVANEKNEMVIKGTKTTNSTRVIYIPKDVADSIKEQGYAYNGTATALWKRLRAAQDKLSIPHFRFHDLRAYYASFSHMIGIPDQLIQEGGGWKTDYTMKRIYRRTMQDAYRESQKTYLENLSDIL